MKTNRFGLLLLSCAILAVGCNGGGDTAKNEATGTSGGDKPAPERTIRIAMIAKSTSNPVFTSAHEGAKAAAKELGEKNGVSIMIDWLTPAEEDGQEQAKRVAQAVNEGVSCILLSASDAGKLKGAVDDAVDRGVPVMTFDSDVAGSKRFAFYGVDDIETGKQVMKELAAAMGGKGTIGILAGNQNAPNLQKRVQGVEEEAKNYPGIKIKSVFNHSETPQDAASKMQEAMNANPDINGWALIGGWPLFTKTLLDLDPNKYKIVSVDALPAQLAYVEKGIAPVLLAQPTYKWGYVSVEKIVDKLVLKKDVEEMNKMDLVKVTKDNLGDWARQLKEWNFDGIDQKYLDMPAAKK